MSASTRNSSEAAVRLSEELAIHLDEALEATIGRETPVIMRSQGAVDFLDFYVGDLKEDVVLAADIVVDGRLRELELRGDVVNSRLMKAAFCEKPRRAR